MSSYPVSLPICLFVLIAIVSLSIPVLSESTGSKSDQNITQHFIPVVITSPGVYHLTKDYTVTHGTDGITIQTDDVSIEGDGHILQTNNTTSDQIAGIRISGQSKQIRNISITSLSINGFQSGIRMENVEDADVKNCSLISNLESGITLANTTNVTINSSTISGTHSENNAGGDGISITNSQEVTLRSVQVTGSGSRGSGSGLQITGSSFVTLDKVTVDTSAGSGISAVGNVPGLIIRTSIISTNSANGITLGKGCTGSQISDSQIRDNTLTGIEITSADAGILAGNMIENNQIGLSMSNAEDFSLNSNNLKNNRINFDVTGSNPAEYWHYIDRSNLADGRPIWYLLESRDISISSADNPSCIYAVNCSNLSIADQVLSKNGAGIFLVNSDSVTISQVSALDNTFGIRSGYESRNISIMDSSTETNLIAGYAIADSQNVTFRSCTAQNNLVGFFCSATRTLLIERCDAYQQQGLRRRGPSGFLISGCSNVSVVNSSASRNQFDGIYLKDSPQTLITNSTLSSNDIAGVAVLAEGTNINNSIISVNSAGGILIYGNSSALQGNRIEENKGRGLIIDSATGTKVWNNLFNNSRNVEMTGVNQKTEWNSTPEPGTGITGYDHIGGNYWGALNHSGFSDVCAPDAYGFCNDSYQPGSDGFDQYPVSSQKLNCSESSEEVSALEISDDKYDIDKNGQVNLQDVVALMQGIISGTMTGSSYDFSQDDKVNLEDVVTFFHLII